jgi:hypothetical protein
MSGTPLRNPLVPMVYNSSKASASGESNHNRADEFERLPSESSVSGGFAVFGAGGTVGLFSEIRS